MKSKTVAAIAKEHGWDVVHHEVGFLFVDLDSLEALHRFEVEVDRLMEAVPELVRGRYVARSPGGNWHGYVYCAFRGHDGDDSYDEMYVLLHLLLGSDPEHEKLALARIRASRWPRAEPPFCFFEEPEQAVLSRLWMAGIREAARAEEEAVVGARQGEYAGVTMHVLKNGATRIVTECQCVHCAPFHARRDE